MQLLFLTLKNDNKINKTRALWSATPDSSPVLSSRTPGQSGLFSMSLGLPATVLNPLPSAVTPPCLQNCCPGHRTPHPVPPVFSGFLLLGHQQLWSRGPLSLPWYAFLGWFSRHHALVPYLPWTPLGRLFSSPWSNWKASGFHPGSPPTLSTCWPKPRLVWTAVPTVLTQSPCFALPSPAWLVLRTDHFLSLHSSVWSR